MPQQSRLTRSEDALLRRLHYFSRLGATLADAQVQVVAELRARDTRDEVRPPFELAASV